MLTSDLLPPPNLEVYFRRTPARLLSDRHLAVY
jgi:hypothetical protein